jgi:outer membrane protein assembly factor BamE (lipoprotein component of BamABCDE complex)
MPHPFRPQRSCPLLLLAGLFLLLSLAACGGGASPGSGSAAESDQEWLWLQRSKQELDQKREQLAALGPVVSRPAASAVSPASPTAAGPAPEAARLAREVETLTAELDRRLVDFVNANPPVQGEPLTRRQQAALRMKSDEDLEIARQYAQKGGDYQRAAEICEAALAVDPDNPALKDELEKIRSARFMTSERFSEAKRGMTPPEVRELLGAPNPHNVHPYPERGIEAWFYPRDPAGTAAGVWFEKRPREEDTRVYQLDFDAIKPGASTAAPALPVPAPSAPPAPAGKPAAGR